MRNSLIRNGGYLSLLIIILFVKNNTLIVNQTINTPENIVKPSFLDQLESTNTKVDFNYKILKSRKRINDNIASKCQPMFEISSNPSANAQLPKINKNTERVSSAIYHLIEAKKLKTQSSKDYLPFVNFLPPMVTHDNGVFEFRNETRLMQMNGKLPYLSCTVRMYSAEDIQTCFRQRSRNNASSWMAFVGDSKMRKKFLHLAKTTNHLYEWKLKLFPEKRTINVSEYFYNHKAYKMKTVEAIAVDGPKLSYVFAPFGLQPNVFSSYENVYKWITSKRERDIPDVIFLDFGMWYMNVIHIFYNDAYDRFYEGLKYALKLLTSLKKKVTLILLAKTRSRSLERLYNKINKKQGYGSNPLRFHQWHLLNHEMLQPASSDYLDTITLTASEHLDVLFWDSTVPFNLASGRECKELVEANHSVVVNEYKDNLPLNKLMCHDNIHKSEPTLQDETTMILNMLCNNFLPDIKQPFCCV